MLNRVAKAVPCVILVMVFAIHSHAAIYQWSGGGPIPKAFNNSANWNSGIVPGALDRANVAISDTVVFTTSPTNDDSFITGGNFANGITVNLNQSGNQTWNLDVWHVIQKANVVLNGTDVAVEFGTILSEGGVITVNSGSTYAAGGINTSPTAPNTFGVTGQINVNPGGVLAVSGWLQLGAGSPVKSSHGTLNLNGGTVTSGNDVLLADSGSTDSTGRIAITNGGVMTQTGPGKLYIGNRDDVNGSAATLSISGAGSAYVQQAFGAEIGSTLQGAGTLLVTSGGRFQHGSNFNVNKRGSVILSNGGFFLGNMSIKGGHLSFANSTIDGSIDVSNSGSINATSTYEVFPTRRLGVTNGVATFAGGVNLSINSTGTITSGSGAIINSAGTSTWGSGANGLAFGSLNGVTNISNLKIGANGGAATINITNGGTLNVSNSGGLTIGDNVGTAPAIVKVNGPVGGVVMGQFAPTFINRRGTLQLLGGGFYRGEQLTVDGGTFDGSAGTYTFNATNPFVPSVTVTNGGSFRGADLGVSPGFLTVSTGGQVVLTGAFLNSSGINGVIGTNVSGANSLLQANSAVVSRTSMHVGGGGVASFNTVSLAFHPFGGTTLSLNTGGVLNVSNSMDIASNARLTIGGGTGNISGALTNAGTITLVSGALNVAGQTNNSGTIQLGGGLTSGNFAAIDGTGTVNSTGNGALTFDHLRQSVVDLRHKVVLTSRAGGGDNGVSRLNSLSMLFTDEASSRWNLNDNDLIIDYPTAGPTPAASIRSLLIRGHNAGAWTGSGLSSASAAADPRTALGYVDNAALHLTSFGGQTVDDSCVLVKYTYHGDADLNGVINFDDYARIDAGFNNGGDIWLEGDFDYNGVVNFDDYALIDLAFNTQTGTLRTLSAVPEPATLSLPALIAAVWLRSRRQVRR